MKHRAAHVEGARPDHSALYRVGALAALMAALLTLAEVVVFAIYPQPGTIGDWFALFQSSRLMGLVSFWGLELLMYAMFPLVFLALYRALRPAHEDLALVALTFALLGTAVFFATNNPVAMLSLSNQHAAATSDAERSLLLAAGQAVLANTSQRGVGGFNAGLFLVSVGGLAISSVMLRSAAFGKSAAYVGVLAHALSLLDYARQALTSSPALTLLVVIPNALLLIAWFVLVARRLDGLRQSRARLLPQPS